MTKHPHDHLQKCVQEMKNLLDDEIKRDKARKRSAGGNSCASRFLVETLSKVESIEQHLARSDLECAVVGITKAGKSTLINALIGHEILPVSNVPETALNIKIRHSPSSLEPCLLEPVPIKGVLAIRKRLSEHCENTRDTRVDNGATLEANLSCLAGMYWEAHNHPLQYCLVDTPGVTEAAGSFLTEKTFQTIDSADLVICALNYGNLRTEAEKRFLQDFAHRRPDFFLRGRGRLITVLTQIDQRNRTGESIGNISAYLRDHVSSALKSSLPEFAARVFPIRGELALLGKLASHGRFERPEQENDYLNILFGSEHCQNLSESNLRSLGKRSVEISGILTIEGILKNSVRNASRVREDSVRSRLLHTINRSLKWSEFTTGKLFVSELNSLRRKLLRESLINDNKLIICKRKAS